MNAIEFRAVTFSYHRPDNPCCQAPVLNSITASIARGEFAAILGKKGSGKTTFLKLCCGLLHPTEGVVTMQGREAGDTTQIWEIRTRCGVVFQHPESQIFGATVVEDVAFGPENLGLPPQLIRERVREALLAVGLEKLHDMPTHLLSGGQKVRLVLAGVLALEPDCLLVDEAAAQLEPAEREEIAALLRALNRERGITVVQATGDLEVALSADRVIVLDAGKIARDGTPAQVRADMPQHLVPPPPLAPEVGELHAPRKSPPALNETELRQHPAGSSVLHRLDARTKVASVLFFMFAVLFLKGLPALLLLLCLTLALASLAGKPLRQSLRGMKAVVCLSLAAVVVNLVSVKGTPLVEYGILSHLSREGLTVSAVMLARILLIASVASLLTFTTPPLALAGALEKLLKPLSRAGIRVSELAMMLLLALRFLPVIVEEAQRLVAAQSERGVDLKSGSLLQRAKNCLPLFIPLFAGVARRGDALATAMDARCYRGGTGRTRMDPPRFCSADALCLAGMMVIMSLGVIA